MDIKNDGIESGRYINGRIYDLRFIKRVIQEIEDGLPERLARKEYQISYSTLRDWIKRYASAEYLQNGKRNISVQQKRTVARSVQEGRLSRKEACRIYDVAEATLRGWLKYFAKENAEIAACNSSPEMNKKPKKTDPPIDPSDELKELRQQLEDERLKVAALNTLIDVAEDQLKINIRKKPGARQS